jgi:hypothetical protein
LRTEGCTNHFDSEFSLETLAGKDVDIGLAGKIAEMAGDGRGLDQLHKRVSGRLGQMFGEMLKHRRPIRLLVSSERSGICHTTP